MSTKKPKRVPIDGAWRVIEYRHGWGANPHPQTWYPGRRWLYDTDLSFEQQWKTKVTGILNWPMRADNSARLTAEQFDGKKWVQIREWIGPTPEQRLERGLRP